MQAVQALPNGNLALASAYIWDTHLSTLVAWRSCGIYPQGKRQPLGQYLLRPLYWLPRERVHHHLRQSTQ
eukprot:501384-Ditylum_brightwellii.AAC.1